MMKTILFQVPFMEGTPPSHQRPEVNDKFLKMILPPRMGSQILLMMKNINKQQDFHNSSLVINNNKYANKHTSPTCIVVKDLVVEGYLNIFVNSPQVYTKVKHHFDVFSLLCYHPFM